jgi:hypothetical protein
MDRSRLKWFIKFIFIPLFILLLGSELILRKMYGFADAILFREDKDFEYIPLPQSKIRFNHNVIYNSFSQRNREIAPTDSVIILGFGDSVLNGGVLVDQDSLATEMLSKFLTKKYRKNYVVTNISAPSWGPDNCFAYLKKYGNFGAKQIILVVSSHDAYDNMTFKKIVGIHRNYPNLQYQLAIFELFDRYLYFRYLRNFIGKKESNKNKNKNLGINKYKDGMPFNGGFEKFKEYSDSANIPLLIYLHAEIGELQNGKYNKQGQQIIKFCESNHIPLIKELDYHLPKDSYLDNIHLSEKGQHYMFEILKNYH